MDQVITQTISGQLEERRDALQNAIAQIGPVPDLARLLNDVDQALARLKTDEFGKCVVCDGRMDDAEMLEFPTRQYCLCDLSASQQDALQRDLDLAWQVQASLLPKQNLSFGGWQSHFRYLPAGPVSGDYCDMLTHEAQGGWLYFLVGDVSGKGIAAAYLMAHLSAAVRRILEQPISVDRLMESVNRHLNERSTESHFVTLVAGRAHRSGRVEICNAGHCHPIVLRSHEAFSLSSSGLPVGILEQADPQTTVLQMENGDSLVLHTDGISEAGNPAGELFGAAALRQTVFGHRALSPAPLAATVLDQVRRFQSPAPQQDDITLLILRRG
jgi:sigma-B regulation protein RsbU (phosphoserine phosphatase)